MEHLMEAVVPYIIHLLEAMGIFIIAFTGIKSFIKYVIAGFNFVDDIPKIELVKALALGLEFLLGGEILKTLTIRQLKEVYVLAAIMALRLIITYVLHWEVQSEMKHCNHFLKLIKNGGEKEASSSHH